MILYSDYMHFIDQRNSFGIFLGNVYISTHNPCAAFSYKTILKGWER